MSAARRTRAATPAMLVLALLGTGMALAACAGEAAAGAARDRLDRALRGLKDATAPFVQVRDSGPLGLSETRGTLSYRAPRRVRVDYTGKLPATVLVRADTAWLYQPTQKQVVRMGAAASGAPPLPFFEESVAVLERAYVLTEAGDRRLVLTPRAPAGTPWREVVLDLDPRTGLPSRVAIHQADGESVTLRFERFRINTGLPAARFEARFPADAKLIEL